MAHVRNELGILEISAARSLWAAFPSAYSFSVGVTLPLGVTADCRLLNANGRGTALVSSALLGALGAKAGGAGSLLAVLCITFWNALAMAVTSEVGTLSWVNA